MSLFGTLHTLPPKGAKANPQLPIEDLLKRHQQIFQVGRVITAEMDMENLFQVIMDQTVRMVGAERCSLFLYDENASQLWSLVGTELEKNQVRFPAVTGVAGWVFRHREPLLIPDAYADDRFNPKIDQQTGFRTRSILCIPLINRHDTCIGTLEALNKRSGPFTASDLDLLKAISHYVAIALENAKLYEELKRLNASKKSLIDHLGRELRIPLAAVVENSETLFGALEGSVRCDVAPSVERCRQNLQRLTTLAAKVNGFMESDSEEGPRKGLQFIEDAPALFDPMQNERLTPEPAGRAPLPLP